MKTIYSILWSIIFFSNVIFAQNDTCINFVNLGISFPPVANADQQSFTQGHLENLNVSLIRIGEDWSLREQVEGVYNWGPLDARMNWIEDNNYDILLTIQSNGPDWACNSVLQNELSCAFSDSAAFRTYIDTLLIRYGENIAKIQFGNEWHSEYWYAGYARDFIKANNTLWESVQENSPDTKVVLGGFASGTMTTLAACYGYLDSVRLPDSDIWYQQQEIDDYCNSAEIIYIKQRQDSILTMCNYDIIDMHLYDDVENWPLYYHIMDSITEGTFPIIVSEMGGPNLFNELPYSDEFQSERLFQYIKCVDSLEISEAYYFKLVAGGNSAEYHQESGLIDGDDLIEKQAYFLFKTMNIDCGSVDLTNYTSELFNIYPNPVNNEIIINSLVDVFEIQIINIFGQTIYAQKNESRIDASNFSAGIYFVRFQSSNTILVKKILVN